jgi:RHH-type proline utilization regulon transcriptional repressor/proline dehydrogenase/delta 1-pyrroline-5-carboxylate dehydrogenase
MSVEVDSVLIEKAVELARTLQERATELQTAAERRQQAELDRMLQTPHDMATLVQMTDQAFRSRTPERIVDQFTHILDVQGVPRFFSPFERALLFGFQSFGGWMPGVAAPLVKEHMQHETANVVLPGETELLTAHLNARKESGLRMNVNFLGEVVLGEAEAQRRLDRYLEALRLPEIEVVSVKISTLYSQVSSLAGEQTIAVLCDRIEALYREAAAQCFVRANGKSVPKFVYLDMEEYRDLALTAEAFMRTLERPGLEKAEAGIALQAYIPDSAAVQRTINSWAQTRVSRGGAPVSIRLVKGANMEMERVEASLRGWPQAPFKTKRETDANYKRMLIEAMRPVNLAAVRVGVASHNLFDVAFALVLAQERQAGEHVQFEMLEGMANHQRRALEEVAKDVLLYAPACRKSDFIHAIGYLIRRLDENSGPENFLRHAFRLRVGSDDWLALERGFRAAFALDVSDAPRRTQSRLIAPSDGPRPEVKWRDFRNEPDTDFVLPQNVEWANKIVARWQEAASDVPLVVAGAEIREERKQRNILDPSRPEKVPGTWREANAADVENAVACARRDEDGWRTRSLDERSEILGKVAQELRAARGDMIGAALVNAGKTIPEADPEVSEAVDFVEFYRASTRSWFGLKQAVARPKGVVVVVSPWNFPIAIPCGGIAAALAAGNTVILKPASDTVLVAWELCRCFWRAGVSQRTLQFLPCPGSGPGAALVQHAEVDAVILTGGTETALRMLAAKPALRLYAETGGKNATIVTALSDREQAIKNVLHSAFSHSGQKCSATSLLLLEAELYDDPEFREALADAVESLRVGPAADFATRIGPLIRPPAGDLEWALTSLDEGEEWAVQPRNVGGNPNLWSPGVKYGVTPGSRSHRTEFFGPVLSVMRFTRLDEAISLVNATGYGLTSGLESLDDREIERWRARIRAGNLYINRPTTGAIVLRQPFGGLARSSIGPGMKTGGPNYVAQFLEFEERIHPCIAHQIEHPRLAHLRAHIRGRAPQEPEMGRLVAAIESYDSARLEEFSREHEHFRLIGEDNLRRYPAFREVRVRVDSRDTFFEIFARSCAAKAAGCRVTVSTFPGEESAAVQLLDELTDSWAASIEFLDETDEQLADAIIHGRTRRVRYAAPDRVPKLIREAAASCGFYIADAPVLAEGRVELLWYLREQSVSHAYHRYGNLGARAGEQRAEPL